METANDGLGFHTKSDLVYEHLRDAIVRGEMAPGTRLDQEQLSTALQVSRQPLRQALLRLVADALVEWEPHRSAVVAPLSREGFEELYAMRVALESMLARVAGTRLTDDDIERLEQLCASMSEAVAGDDLGAFVRLDREFHATLYRPAGYLRALADIRRLRDLTDRYIHFFAVNDGGALTSLAEHASLVAAARGRDSDLLATLIAAHIERGALTLRTLIADDADVADSDLRTA